MRKNFRFSGHGAQQFLIWDPAQAGFFLVNPEVDPCPEGLSVKRTYTSRSGLSSDGVLSSDKYVIIPLGSFREDCGGQVSWATMPTGSPLENWEVSAGCIRHGNGNWLAFRRQVDGGWELRFVSTEGLHPWADRSVEGAKKATKFNDEELANQYAPQFPDCAFPGQVQPGDLNRELGRNEPKTIQLQDVRQPQAVRIAKPKGRLGLNAARFLPSLTWGWPEDEGAELASGWLTSAEVELASRMGVSLHKHNQCLVWAQVSAAGPATWMSPYVDGEWPSEIPGWNHIQREDTNLWWRPLDLAEGLQCLALDEKCGHMADSRGWVLEACVTECLASIQSSKDRAAARQIQAAAQAATV